MGSLLFHSKMLKYNKIDKSCPKSANKKEMSLITPIKVLLWNIIHFSFASVLQLINTYAIAGWLCGFFSLHLIKFGLLAILPRSPQFGLSLFRCLLSLHLYLACFRISKKQQIYKICIINNIVLISLSTYIWIVQHYTTKKILFISLDCTNPSLVYLASREQKQKRCAINIIHYPTRNRQFHKYWHRFFGAFLFYCVAYDF